MNSRLATIGPAHTETCTWVVEAPEYVRRRNESSRPEHHGVLWVKGKPGSGNSTLMKYALDIAQERDDGGTIAFFLFTSFLLSYGPDILHRGKLKTALDYALLKRRTRIARLLWDARCPKSKWNLTLLACTRKTGEHRYDAVAIHDMERQAADADNRGHESGGADSSNYPFERYNSYCNSYMYESSSSESITTAKTI